MRGTVHHIDLSVASLAASALFYDLVLGFLGYRRSRTADDGIDWDLAGDLPGPGGAACSIGLKPARSDRPHDRYSAGLHHLAWHAAGRGDVDRLHALLVAHGAAILDPPAEYPAYGAGYYALFFADPDGLKLEFVHFPAA
jgi:catechol 2,3-dioxygenase-like lactoylglutathione lyase family enzyme